MGAGASTSATRNAPRSPIVAEGEAKRRVDASIEARKQVNALYAALLASATSSSTTFSDNGKTVGGRVGEGALRRGISARVGANRSTNHRSSGSFELCHRRLFFCVDYRALGQIGIEELEVFYATTVLGSAREKAAWWFRYIDELAHDEISREDLFPFYTCLVQSQVQHNKEPSATVEGSERFAVCFGSAGEFTLLQSIFSPPEHSKILLAQFVDDVVGGNEHRPLCSLFSKLRLYEPGAPGNLAFTVEPAGPFRNVTALSSSSTESSSHTLIPILRFFSFIHAREDLKPLVAALSCALRGVINIEHVSVSATTSGIRKEDVPHHFSSDSAHRLHFGVVCLPTYVKASELGCSNPLELLCAPMRGERYADSPNYFSALVVRKESDANSLNDLRGKTVAYNDELSHSGFHSVGLALWRKGLDGSKFFGRSIKTGSHRASLALVMQGVAQGAAIDTTVADRFLKTDEFKRVFKVVEILGPEPIQPLVIAKDIPEAVRHRIRAAFLSMHESRDELLSPLSISRFVQVEPTHFDGVRDYFSPLSYV